MGVEKYWLILSMKFKVEATNNLILLPVQVLTCDVFRWSGASEYRILQRIARFAAKWSAKLMRNIALAFTIYPVISRLNF